MDRLYTPISRFAHAKLSASIGEFLVTSETPRLAFGNAHYSDRSAFIGSIEAAVNAGPAEATKAARNKIPIIAASMAGSRTFPFVQYAKTRLSATLIETPTAVPTSTDRAHRRETSSTM
jgi:hypothetical protein